MLLHQTVGAERLLRLGDAALAVRQNACFNQCGTIQQALAFVSAPLSARRSKQVASCSLMVGG